MPLDQLERLAEVQVPPPPVEFDRQVHQRVNQRLLALHLVDFAVRALPWAMAEFARALCSALVRALTGKDVDANREK